VGGAERAGATAIIVGVFDNRIHILLEKAGIGAAVVLFIVVFIMVKREMRDSVMMMMGNESMRQHHYGSGKQEKYCKFFLHHQYFQPTKVLIIF
jgi:hypothetical protein